MSLAAGVIFSEVLIIVILFSSQETMMDHPLKTISYIADIGNIVVIMARRRSVKTLEGVVEESGVSVDGEGKRQPRKIICHVFETEDVSFACLVHQYGHISPTVDVYKQ